MASFGSTKCARNSVSRAKSCDACVVGGKDRGKKIARFLGKIASVCARRMPLFVRKINEPSSIIFLGSRPRKRPSRGKLLREF